MNRRNFFATIGGGLLAVFGYRQKVEARPDTITFGTPTFTPLPRIRKGKPVVWDKDGNLREAEPLDMSRYDDVARRFRESARWTEREIRRQFDLNEG